MKQVLADTSFYQALLNPGDRFHAQAHQVSDHFRVRVVTSEYILCELGALMCRTHLRKTFIGAVRKLQSAREVEVVSASHQLFESGLALFNDRADKNWSLTDCISFQLMRDRRIFEAFTTDKHFEQAGFRNLLVAE
jgi:hypothetical protein